MDKGKIILPFELERIFDSKFICDILSDYDIFDNVAFHIVDDVDNEIEKIDDMFEYGIIWEIKQAMWGWNSN